MVNEEVSNQIMGIALDYLIAPPFDIVSSEGVSESKVWEFYTPREYEFSNKKYTSRKIGLANIHLFVDFILKFCRKHYKDTYDETSESMIMEVFDTLEENNIIRKIPVFVREQFKLVNNKDNQNDSN